MTGLRSACGRKHPRALHNAVSALRCEADIRLGFDSYLARR